MPRPSKTDGPIVYIVGQSLLGQTLAAASPRGVCMLAFADSRRALIEDIERRFPGSSPATPRDPAMPRLRSALRHVATPWKPVTFPLDLKGTDFQKTVWRALKRIPAGHTASYRDIARAIGAPTASRAVAGACGANPISIAIPCHRVLHSDGSISGYRWGVERKRKLLALESQRKVRSVG